MHKDTRLVLQSYQTVAKRLIVLRLLAQFLKDQTGATSIEYSVVAGGIALVLVGVVKALGTNVFSMYQLVLTTLK
jgi:pilus assembly protein Flp/PilA